MDHPAIEVRLLGSFEVRVDGTPVHVPRGRPRALLATLALARGRVVSVEVLAERMWGEDPPQHARNAVQNNVRRLRLLLGAEAIATTVDGYLLPVSPDNVDALRFFTLTETAAATEDPVRARELIVEAMSLWQGEPLTGVGHVPLERDQAATLTERYLAALERRIDIDMAGGGYLEVIAELRELTARHVLRESLWARLLVALHRLGRRAEALDTYERIRRHLADQLGADPSPGLQRIYQQLLCDDTGAADEPDPESPAGAAPAGETPMVPRQLPPTRPDLVGREAELAELDGLLDAERGVSICVLHGAGGMGKSTLATHWAHRIGSRFPDGQLFLDLQGYGPEAVLSAAAALSALLRSTGLSPEAIPADVGAASALLRTTMADKRMLLLLDNARDPDQVRPLLPGGESLVVVTSRHQMTGLAVREGAYRIELHEISEPDALALLTATVGEQRVAAEPRAARDLVARCARLPLALRITAEMASRFPQTRLADLVQELGESSQRLDALADDEDAAADVRAVFSWSYLALKPESARAFRLLGLYPGTDIGLPAAAALLGVPDNEARTQLGRLAAVHLVEQRRRGRFQMHDLLRAYATECAADEASGERDAAIVRLLDWYLHTLHNARLALRFTDGRDLPMPPTDPSIRPREFDECDAAGWYESERLALVAAVRLAADQGHWRHGWQLAARQRDFCELRSDVDDWVTVAELGHHCAKQTGDPVALYLSAGALGSGYSHTGQHERAEELLRVDLEYARRLGQPVKLASSWSRLGVNASRAGDHETAIGYHEESVRTARGSGHPYRMAHSLLNLSSALLAAGRAREAVEAVDEALRLYRQVDAGLPQALALANIAEAYHELGQQETASRYAEQALQRFATGGWRPTLDALYTAGRIQAALGNSDTAREIWTRAVRVMAHDSHPRMSQFRALISGLDDLS